MDNKDKIAARIVILPEILNEKTNSMMDLREYYGEWYSFKGEELDVSLYSESYLDKEKTKKEITYFYKSPKFGVKLIPRKHCKVVYEFL